ncbi:hypothetical protein MRX96_023689 [Rhipicephalus microplus]
MVCVGSMACSCCSFSGCPGTMANEGGRHHAWRCQKDVGLWPQDLWDDKRRGARRSWMSPMEPGPRLRSQGQARGMGWPQGQLDPLYLSQRALGLPRCALHHNRAVAQARNVLVQQESARRRSSRKHARLRCRGVPDEQRTPCVEPHRGSALHRGRRLRRWYRRGPRCVLVLGRPGTGTGWSPLPKAWSCSRCRSTAWAGSVAVFGWMSRGAPEVRGLGLAETTCATPGLDAGACYGATGRGATVAVALVVAGVDADDEGRLWLREGTALGPVVDHETETGTGAGTPSVVGCWPGRCEWNVARHPAGHCWHQWQVAERQGAPSRS